MSAAAMKRDLGTSRRAAPQPIYTIGWPTGRSKCNRPKCRWPGQARPSQCVPPGVARLLQRLDLDDRGTVVVADPEHRSRPGLLDEHATDVSRARQEIFSDLAALGVEPRHVVVRHRAGPHLRAALARHDVVRVAPCLRQLEFLHLLGCGVEHADRVAAILGKPETALIVESAAPRPRALRRRRPDLDLAGFGAADADTVAAELQHVDVVVLVGRVAVAADLAIARLGGTEILPFEIG